ncbi:DNA repair protein RAD10 [Kluyveromyces lactis]|uniref:KLLA0D10307p n=1 Tax=Kluyveromyces lactis (strain ATCC 8585 / CBS 2359 / DSM 70799 / NBRC 1267 / NRRL Y-1140 / WM37) TaxID=284590 RepID=Q6CRB9_KLULA|nr:uncharacterized protein KLLA0_D10307g [Kluyveromyces lactis]CAH00616.1 KLLA0D10307p [Kluyveromyces lactis]|eukprot:XP_453520.1 uncharacterized protein KLLA0_D10307g [Kluyveromyces lactis]
MVDDTTSFESILANVRKRRAEFNQPSPQPQQSPRPSLQQNPAPELTRKQNEHPNLRDASINSQQRSVTTSKPSGPVINSFNQQHDTSPGNAPVIHNQKKAVQESSFADKSSSSKTMFVSSSQTGNPLLKSLVNVNWRYVKSTPTTQVHYDYQIRGRNVIFLSLKYHKLHPEYIGKKLLPFKRTEGNVLLCVVDVENSEDILRELNKVCMFQGFTILLAFTFEQAGKYLTFMNK